MKSLAIIFLSLFALSLLKVNAQIQNSKDTVNCIEENISSLSEAKKPLEKNKIRVVGYVRNPIAFDVIRPTNTLEVLAMAGGIGDEYSYGFIKILKPIDENNVEIIEFSLRNVLLGKFTDIKLQGGETVLVLRNCKIEKIQLPKFREKPFTPNLPVTDEPQGIPKEAAE